MTEHILIGFKRWSTDGMNDIVLGNIGDIAEDDRQLLLSMLDHIQAVDEIFKSHLEGGSHGYQVPRSPALPPLTDLVDRARAVGKWYVDYAGALTREQMDEAVSFNFANGQPAIMTRGEILLHVVTHASGHHGQVALLLQKNGIQPHASRITDFLEVENEKRLREKPSS